MKMQLQRVHYMPQVLEPGILYVSEDFDIAMHLCASGCGSKISTPLGPTEWSFKETLKGPSLYPSIGNWQKPCQSHYWIREGEIIWAKKWSPEQILEGRKWEEKQRHAYYSDLDRNKRKGTMQKLLDWLKNR